MVSNIIVFVLFITFETLLGQYPFLPRFPRRIFKDGDFVVGAIMPITKDLDACSEDAPTRPAVVAESILWTEAVIFIVNRINEHERLLGNFTLGYDIRDSCMSRQVAVKHALDFIGLIDAAHPLNESAVCIENHTSSASPSRTENFGEGSESSTSRSPTGRLLKNHGFFLVNKLTPSGVDLLKTPDMSIASAVSSVSESSCGEKPIAAVIGCLNSDLTSAVAGVVQASMLPMVGVVSTVSTLTDPVQYPTFMRTVIDDRTQAKMLAQIVRHYGWSYISVIGTENEYGRQGTEALFDTAESMEICLALKEYFDPDSSTRHKDLQRIITAVREKRNATVVVLFMAWKHVDMILQEAERQNLTGVIWMATESWGSHPGIKNYSRSFVEGAIGLSLPKQLFPGFHQYLQDLDVICSPDHIWMYHLLCARGECHPDVIRYHKECCLSYFNRTRKMACPLPPSLKVLSILEDLIDFIDTNTVFDGVYAVAHGIRSLIEDTPASSSGEDPSEAVHNRSFRHEDLLQHMKMGRFTNFRGKEIKFRSNGDIFESSYDVVSLQYDECKGALVWKTIGEASTINETVSLKIVDGDIRFAHGAPSVTSRCSAPCEPGSRVLRSPRECCWECQPCPDGTVSNSSMSTECVQCLVNEHTDVNKTRCVHDTLHWLFLTDPVGIVILVASVLGQIITLTVISILGHHRNNPVCSALAFKTTSLLVCYAGFLQPVIYTVQPSTMLCIFQKVSWFSVYIVHGATLVARTYKVKTFVDKLKRVLGNKIHNVHHFIMWMFAVVGFALLGVSLLDNVPTVKYIKHPPEEAFPICVERLNLADLPIIAHPLLLLVITGLLAETSKHSRSLDDKFLAYTSSAMLLMLVVFLPIYYSIDDGIGKVIILAVSVIITQYAVLCLTYFTKIYYMFRNYHKKENFRSALALERQTIASLNEVSQPRTNGASNAVT